MGIPVCCRNRSLPMCGPASGDAAEIQAATTAIELAVFNQIDRLCIRTDSELLLNSVMHEMPVWKRNDWTDADGHAVKNQQDFLQLDTALNRFYLPLKWEMVQSRSGDYGNAVAYCLAIQGAEMYRNEF